MKIKARGERRLNVIGSTKSTSESRSGKKNELKTKAQEKENTVRHEQILEFSIKTQRKTESQSMFKSESKSESNNILQQTQNILKRLERTIKAQEKTKLQVTV